MTLFDTKEYLELRKKENYFYENTNQLSYSEFRKDFLKIVNYRNIFRSQVYYNRKEDYRRLIEKYLSKKICFSEFKVRFDDISSENFEKSYQLENDFEKLVAFLIEPESKGFYDYIDTIEENSWCVVAPDTPADQMGSYQMYPTEFDQRLKENFSKMQPYFDF